MSRQQLRYFLHGQKDQYENVQTSLYVTSQDSTVWQKVGQQVLHQKGEAWRLLDSVLVEHIPSAKRQQLGIEALQSEQVVKLIQELGADCVNGSQLEPSERYELLRYISQFPSYQNLWRSLRLHETTNGKLECIELGRVFLENPGFSLDSRLKERITLIRENQEIQQNWIPQWTPREAIVIMLNLPNPHEYCNLILNALNKISSPDKAELKKNLQHISWLPNQYNNQGISPINILRVPNNVAKHQEKLAKLDQTKYPENIQPESWRQSKGYSYIRELFTSWKTETLIKNILSFSQKSPQYWQEFCIVILDAIQDFEEIPNDLKTLLETESWISVEEGTIKPTQILEIIPNRLKKYLSNLVDLSNGEYTQFSQLPENLKNHESFKLLRNFFSKWNENDIIEFILNQPDPHQHCEIILDTLSNLLDSRNLHKLSSKNLNQLKTKAWLVTQEGNAVFPKNILHYPALEEDIEALLLSVSSEYIPSSQVSKLICDRSNCWSWLTEELLITQDAALEQIGELLNNAPEYQLGNFTVEFPLDECLEIFNQVDVSFLPAWSFAQKLDKNKFKNYLLPNLLGKIESEKSVKILEILSHQNPEPEESKIKVFNAYLSLAVKNGILEPQNLAKIKLLNQKQKWQNSEQLTWGIRDNIERSFLLNRQQEQLLKPYLNTLKDNPEKILLTTESLKAVSNVNLVKEYFEPWQQYCPSELMGAFLSLFIGNDIDLKNLVQLYLGKRNVDAVRQRLLDNRSIPLRNFQISVGQTSDRTRVVPSILGTTFKANLAQFDRPPHLFVNSLTSDTTEIELLPLETKIFSHLDLSLILKQSTKVLLDEVYQIQTSSLDETWRDLRESDQLDIQVAKTFLLEGAPYVMRMLGIHERSPVIKEILSQWDDLRHQKAELKQQKKSTESIERKIEQLVFELSNLLETKSAETEPIRDDLLQAVRAKISQHGYRHQSIPFELFQNADDAVIEWMQMSEAQQPESTRKEFVIVAEENQLLFIHAGRPIGCFQHPNYPEKQYRERGFDRDLEKMLTFNISDKGEGVTGKFGLGFKSVYLVCKQPSVLSKNLGFTVEGGLIPSRLAPAKARDLREKLKSYPPDATIIELKLEENYSTQDVIEPFLELVNILLVFSRGIKQFKFTKKDHQIVKMGWEPKIISGVPGVEIGKSPITIEKNKECVLLCLKTQGDAAAQLLLGFTEENGCLSRGLPNNVPTFWVTAPTRENLFLGFAINANFEITTGRESLVKSSVRNCELADRIGIALGEVLCRLLRASQENWQAVAETLRLKTVDLYEFWNFIWQELALDWQKRDPSEGRDMIRRILAGDRGMGYLITHGKALPNGLSGNFRQLLLVDEIRYQVTGQLLEPECFQKAANWSRFRQTYQDKLISQSQWKNVKELLGDWFDSQRYPVSDLHLIDALKTEIGAKLPRVSPSEAKPIGTLITKDFLKNLKIPTEQNQLQFFLQEVEFMSKAGTYLPCQQLLCDRSNSSEEMLLVGFAPDKRILHFDYQDSGLNFFWACRLQRETISIEELTEWALQAETPEKRQAVHNYLFSGERRDKLATNIYENRAGSWIVNDSSILDTLELMLLIAIKRGETISEEPEEFIEYNEPNFEFQSNCTQNDFSLSRPPSELEAFAQILITGLASQRSSWKGYIYHFTHIENAVSIIKSESLLARNQCTNFKNSAGENLIGRTSEDVKDFARFYFRPQTPTQWHNETLGKRQGDIYALCPVPVFFRLNLKGVLKAYGSQCAVSDGNLASSSSHYGNSSSFVEQYFDFDHVYSTIQQVGKETFMRAAQQEFIVHQCLELNQLNLEDITIICRTEQDKATLLHLIGKDSKYASRIFSEPEVVQFKSLFYHNNPSVRIQEDDSFIKVDIENYANSNKIQGELKLRFVPDSPLSRQILSDFSDISKISLGESIEIISSRCIKLEWKPNTYMSVYFQENNRDWLIYTNEH